ncbi:MAG TPA: hypothetical protein VLH56_19420 [Dissulfurispiraceae bacterium]|nr:hypothetical protein [Dissulfurispiraceae bacterium]
MSYVLGCDPGSPSWYAAVDSDGKLTWATYSVGSVTPPPAAVIIEWAEAKRGVYRGKHTFAGDLMRLAVEQERIKQLYLPVCPVYCVPRQVILAQAGYSPRRDGKADKWVSQYLMPEYAKRATGFHDGGYGMYYTWRGTPLAKVGARDAMMAALFATTALNAQYLANPGRE